LSKVTYNVYPVDIAALSNENSNTDNGGLGSMTRLAAVQPEVIFTGGTLQPISQIVAPFNFTWFNSSFDVGQLSLISSMMIAVVLPLVTVHHTLLSM